MNNTASYYITHNGVESGPFTMEQVMAQVKDRTITHGDYIWKEGFAEWLPVEHLCPGVATASVLPPPPAPEEERLKAKAARPGTKNDGPSHKHQRMKMKAKALRAPLTEISNMNTPSPSFLKPYFMGVLSCAVVSAGLYCYYVDPSILSDFSIAKSPAPAAASLGISKEKARKILAEQYGITDISKREGAVGLTPLHFAVKDKNVEKIKLLVAAGAEIDTGDMNGVSPLAYACARGDLDAARLLISLGADVNKGRTIENVTRAQNNEGLKFLLSMGADPNQKTSGGGTGLHNAAWYNDVNGVIFLVRAGVNLDIRDRQGRTALDCAEERDHRIIAALIRDDLELRDEVRMLIEAMKNDNMLQFESLTADHNRKDDRCLFDFFVDGETPLMYAARNGKVKYVKKMLELGADPARETIRGETAAQLAEKAHKPHCVQLLQ